MKLVPIPKNKYNDYRLDLIFNCYKWDPQFLDNNTIAKHALIITEEEHKELKELTEKLDAETRKAEEFLNNNLKLAKPLALPKKIYKEIKKMKNYQANKHIRLMRYDFHPTVEGKWAVSEVNSDVPGGFAESSLLPNLARNIINMPELEYVSFGEKMVDAKSSSLYGKITPKKTEETVE